MNRRDLLRGALAGSASASLAACAGPAARATQKAPTAARKPGRLVNDAWAQEQMERAGVAGLVALNPVNVYYLTSHTSFFQRMSVPNAAFAVYAADASRSTYLVTSSADLWALDNERQQHLQVIAYSAPKSYEDHFDQDQWSTPPHAAGSMAEIWPVNEAGLSARERSWLAAGEATQYEAAPVYGLLRALKEAGLENQTIAVDDMRSAELLRSVGGDQFKFVEGDNLLRKIRVVKSDVEVEHMRHIARVNQAACMATMRQLDVGMTAHDISQIFAREAVALGADVMWLVTGGVGGLPDAEVVEGQPILFDAVSHINQYHGDFGRTAVVGEPTAKLEKRAALIQSGWQAAFETLRPGVRYSQVQKVARAAMKKTGVAPARMIVTPHSVGLQHTDEPYRDGLPFTVRDDLILRENMTLTVDFPSIELGWGSCHLEDLVRITADGAEPLGTMDSPLVVV